MSMSAERRTKPGQKQVRLGPRRNGRGQPAWEIALLFPRQGDWTEEKFLDLERQSENRMMELADGVLEILPMPDMYHQGVVKFLFRRVDDHATATDAGEVFFAPCPVRLSSNHLREPDLFFVEKRRIKNRRKPPEGADLAMEVVRPGQENRQRDLVTKRRVYARAGVREYWIIDPEKQVILVLTLVGKRYKVHGKFKPGQRATSKLLSGFSVAVSEVFAAGEGKA